MTDEELIEAIATEVMGWEHGIKNQPDTYYEGFWFKDSKRIIHKETWQPLTDANHRDMVVEEMIAKGFTLKLGRGLTVQGLLTWARFTKEPYSSYHHDKNTGHAVCLAARDAMRGEQDA